MLPKRRFWKTEQKIGRAFSKLFSMSRCPNRVLAYLKSTSKTHARSFVLSSKIFVWGAYSCRRLPQTKILEGRTKRCVCAFEVLFNCMLPKPAVGNSPPFLTNLPFHEFREICNHELWLKYLGNLCSPNEDLGRQNKRSGVRFRSTFQVCEYSIWATTH